MLSRQPQCGNKFVSVGTAIEKLPAFNAIYEYGKNGSVNNCPYDDNFKAQWRNAVRDGVINCQYKPVDLRFFESAYGGYTPKRIDAANLYIKSMCDFDYNIISADAVQGVTPGGSATFTLAKSMHSQDGNYANISAGGSIYIYEDRQWVQVTSVNDTTPYAHQATVTPLNEEYTVNIRKGKKMMFSPVNQVGAYSCSVPHSTWQTPGYIKKISPAHFRKGWEQPIDLSRGYADVLQWAIIFDHEGRQMDAWVPYEQQKAREEIQYRKNLWCFLGQRMTNPALIGTGLTLDTTKYEGFDGLLPTLRYGGGFVYDYDPNIGFSVDADFMNIINRQDSLKKARSFTGMYGLQFMSSLVRNTQGMLKDVTGQINLDSYKQFGADMDQFKKLEVRSYQFLNYRFDFKLFDALTDARSIGNYDMPFLAIMMPNEGNVDSMGNAVAPIEFYMPEGMGESMAYYESPVLDHRTMPDHCDKWSGYVEDFVMMNINCPQNHILIQGVNPCA